MREDRCAAVGIIAGVPTKENEEIRYLRRKSRKRAVRWAEEFSVVRWLELVIAGTCVNLLSEREARIELENFFSVKIVNAGTCDEECWSKE